MPPGFDAYPLFLLAVGILTICGLILYVRMHAFLALILAALLIGLLSPRVVLVDGRGVNEIATAFGRTMAGIGIVIALATIVGKAMMDSGAADRIVRASLRLFGERGSALALLVSSYLLGIPVFFDTVFLLMAPLAKSMAQRTGRNYLLYVSAIAAGASITHSLVPPTPGPLVSAELLGVDVGMTILVGMVVAAPLALGGLAYGAVANWLWPTPVRLAPGTQPPPDRPDHELPPLWVSILPIVLPVVLIGAQTAFKQIAGAHPGLDWGTEIEGRRLSVGTVINFLGNKEMALLIAALVSMLIVATRQSMSRKQLGTFTAQALDEAGMILLITAAGGSFGAVLQLVGVGESLSVLARAWGVPILVLAWGLAALLKCAQGSATVAIITATSIVAGIVKSETTRLGVSVEAYLGYHPVYLVMAIGAGSKIASWMNDSGFWVVCKAGGLTEGEALRSWTMVLVVMGLLGLPVTMLCAWLVPLV
jgi:GntP family gluconate:H+ symporter